MKKLLLFMFAMVLTAQTAWANYGQYNESMSIGGKTINPFEWSDSPDSPTDLGLVRDMTVTSISFNVWDDSNDRGGANMYFRIYDENGRVGEDQDIWLGASTRIAGNHDFSISWTGTEDLAAAVGLSLEAGKTYYIDMWAKTYGDSGDHWYNNGGGNYHAKLTIINTSRTVTSDNYGTICLPFSGTVSGATLYTIESKTANEINLHEEGTTLTAGQAYIFKATSSELNVSSLYGNYTVAATGGALVGNVSADPVTVAVDNYVISENKVKKVVGDAVTCGQYRAYIDLSKVSIAAARGAHFLSFNDEATGIENIQAKENQNVVYNLQGQRVMNGQKGLFIVNGKKVIRK